MAFNIGDIRNTCSAFQAVLIHNIHNRLGVK